MKILIQFEKKPLLFQNPKSIITCYNPAQLSASFAKMEEVLKGGNYLAGFFSYEAGYSFEENLLEARDYEFPLIYMGVYDEPLRQTINSNLSLAKSSLENLSINITQAEYFNNIATIRRYIEKGDVYQITYCIKLLFQFNGEPFELYNKLLKEQPVPYPAYIETEGFRILSLSPEMFVKKISTRLVTKPMKGTWKRGGNILEDLFYRLRFQFDEKNRAENVMIADLLRNDVGRLGLDIRAPRLFEVAKYKKLFQMTSTVTGSVDKDIGLYKLFASLYPSGSVTGAPKIRAMSIIRELEKEERRIYTGAIGYIAPNKDLFFNIPIRTLLLKDSRGEMGIGGGIVWDSTPLGEWNEGLLKARFLTDLANNR